MSQSLSRVIVHIIFSTKNREPWLDSDIRPRMHGYLATICRDLGGEALRGVADHVHIITTLPRTLSQAEMIERIKKPSCRAIKRLLVWGAHAPRVLAMAPSPSLLSLPRHCGEGAAMSTRGACAPQSTIAPALFRRNIVTCCAGMASSSTSAMCGIDIEALR